MNTIQSPFNKARQDKFLINFELPKLLKAHKNSKFFDEYTQFSCYKANVPEISVEAKQVAYAGQHLAISTHTRPAYAPLTINFNVDNRWKNYFTIYNWINVQNDDALSYITTEIFGDLPEGEILKHYITDLSITQLDEYDVPVVKWTYLGAFPSKLSQIDVNQQDSNEIQMTATFNYSQFIPELLIIDK